MEDRELLELAAKACGIRLEWDGHPDQWQPMFYEGKTYHSWNPLEDGGDALRLAVELDLTIYRPGSYPAAMVRTQDSETTFSDPCVLRSIVLAAAEIGKAMP